MRSTGARTVREKAKSFRMLMMRVNDASRPDPVWITRTGGQNSEGALAAPVPIRSPEFPVLFPRPDYERAVLLI
jgi:hypothetical protein